jgi:hypothetical protein
LASYTRVPALRFIRSSSTIAVAKFPPSFLFRYSMNTNVLDYTI